MTKSCGLKGQQKLFFLHLGTAASCCKSYSEPMSSFNSVDHLTSHWAQESQQLDQGQQISSCEYCWQRESQGQQSYRQLKTHEASNQIELYLDNTCNQMCSYCSPKFSSTWENNIVEQGMFQRVSRATKLNLKIEPAAVLHQPWLDQIGRYIQQQPDNTVYLKLLGGEPLMQIKHLQKLVEFNSNKIKQLRLVTNLNPPNNKFLVWLLDNVSPDRLHIDISLDATPEFNHVPRAGFDQHRFLGNLELIQQHGIAHKFLSVVSVLSIFDLPGFVSWAKTHHHAVDLLPLNNPDCLDPKLLPDQFKQQIDPDGLPVFVQDILQPNHGPVDLKLFEQYNYLLEYFNRTQIDPMATSNVLFGQYWDFLSKKFA